MKTSMDVTIVATLRPDIIRQTMESMSQMICTRTFYLRSIVNVDLIGDDCSPYDVLNEVEKIIPIHKYNIADKPSFARAVRWVWRNSTSQYVLHVEDDWKFQRKIDLDWCAKQMEKGDADYIRFAKRMRPVDNEKRHPSLLPSLWVGVIVRSLSEIMVDNKDPEKQLRYGLGNEMIDLLLPKQIVDYPGGICVSDIGREWRNRRNLVKWNKEMDSGEDLTFNGEVTWRRG